jgi:hypothetical protein
LLFRDLFSQAIVRQTPKSPQDNWFDFLPVSSRKGGGLSDMVFKHEL